MGWIRLTIKRISGTDSHKHFSITAQRLDPHGNVMGKLPVEICEYDCLNSYYLIGAHREIQLKDRDFHDGTYGVECYKAEAAEIIFVNASREKIHIIGRTALHHCIHKILPPKKEYAWRPTQKGEPQRPVSRPKRRSDWHSRVLEESGITLAWQGEYEEYQNTPRKPACWTRGKPVTPEQAFEIIRATDTFFIFSEQTVSTYMLSTDWFQSFDYGWCRPDGRIGVDDITGKWPCGDDVIEDGTTLLSVFPFLDLVGIIWDSDEESGFFPEKIEADPPQVEWGFHFHDNTIELLESKTAWERFCDYQTRYGEDPLTYMRGYNEKAGESWVDIDYLKRCLQANGLPDAMVKYSRFSDKERPLRKERLEPESTVWLLYRMRYQRLLEACQVLKRQEQKERK